MVIKKIKFSSKKLYGERPRGFYNVRGENTMKRMNEFIKYHKIKKALLIDKSKSKGFRKSLDDKYNLYVHNL